MIKFTVNQDISCNLDTYWKLFFNPAFNEELYRQTIGFQTFYILDRTENDQEIVRKAYCAPNANAPEPIKSFLGNFSFTEEGRFDKATKVWTFKMTPAQFANELKLGGTVRAVATGANSIRSTGELTFEANVFGIGGAIELFMQGQFTAGWAAGAVFTNKWIADGRPI